MNIALWILQVLLAAVFAAHGWLLMSPPPDLLEIINRELGVGFRLTLGVAEILGAVGILLPGITRVLPRLVEVSAACFAFVSVSATIWHVSRGETSSAAITATLLVLTAFVAYGRWRLRPIRPKQVAAVVAAALLLGGPALAGAQAVGDRVEVNGMQMYYEVSGDGDPLVVLHGAYMNIPSMGEIIPRLAETHRVYALELQGHGRTTDIDRPITYHHLADDVAAFMDAVGLEKADVFGYSMGAGVGLQLAIRHPEKVNRLAAASVAYDLEGWQPAFTAVIPQMTVEMVLDMPFAEEYRELAPDPDGFPALAEKLIALEHEPMAWADDVREVRAPVLIITGDADVVTLEHSVAMFRLLGGGGMGDMGEPLPASRLAVMPATSHTAVITQPDLLHAFIEPFLKGETPKGMFQ